MNESLRFEEDEKIIIISKEEKQFIVSNVISALAYVVKKGSKAVIKQFCQIIKKIVKYEYKYIWTSYVQTIKVLFDSGDDKNIYTGILVFFQISKVHEFETGDDKADYNKSFEELHPYLITFLDNLVPVMQSVDASLYLYKIFKIYFKSIQLEISPTIKNLDNFKKWLTAIITIKKFELPAELTTKTEKTEDIEALQKTIFWKLKTLCFNITYRLYQKYGILTNDNKHKNKEFSSALIETYLPILLETNLQVLYSSRDQYVSDKALYLIFKFLSQLYSKKHLVLVLEKHLDVITREFLIQNALLTLKDVELFTDEPKLYITNQFDITTNYYVLRYTICQFVKSVCSYKRDKEKTPCYFESMYKYFVSVLDMYQDKINKGENIDVRIKEAVLYIMQSLSSEILKYYQDTLEKFMELYVLKEFDSKFGFLRERACTFIESFEEHKIANPVLLESVTKKICGLLQDKELPVRVMAAVAAPKLLRNEACVEMLAPHVSEILKIYLGLMNDIDLEELIEGLEGIISFQIQQCS